MHEAARKQGDQMHCDNPLLTSLNHDYPTTSHEDITHCNPEIGEFLINVIFHLAAFCASVCHIFFLVQVRLNTFRGANVKLNGLPIDMVTDFHI